MQIEFAVVEVRVDIDKQNNYANKTSSRSQRSCLERGRISLNNWTCLLVIKTRAQ